MIARAPTWLRSALAWRWTPAVVLLVGSLIYVLGAILLVPSEISFSGKATTASEGSPTGSAPADADNAADAEAVETGDVPPEAERKVRRKRRARQRPAVEEADTPEEPAVTPSE